MEKMRKVLHEILGEDLSPGEVLRGRRIDLKISQDLLEEITEIKRTNISALENGRIAMTSYYADLLGAALDVHPADLLYPNRKVIKTEDVLKVEKKSKALRKKSATG